MPATLLPKVRNHQHVAAASPAYQSTYRRIPIGYTLLFIIIFTSATTQAQHPSNSGTDFYLSLPLLEHADNEYSAQIVATARRGCSFTVSCPGIGWSQSGNVAANGSTAIALPWSQIYDSTCETTTNRGIHVIATDSIACYLSVFLTNNWGGSGDITIVPPTDLLGSRYIVQTYPSSSNHYHGSSLVVVATEPNTTIDIVPQARTSTGRWSGNPINVHLAQAGDTYRLLSVAGSDLSGTSVTASDGKRIALFCGNRYNGVPNSAGSSDMMFSQVLPTDQWGTEFVVPASNHQAYSDRVRITADSNGAQIHINGTQVATLSAYQTYEYTLASPSADCYIIASQPVLVNLYYPSSVNTYKGDPAQLPIPPIDQTIHHGITFAQNVNNHVSSGNGPYINQHYLDIVTLTDNKANIRVDGNSVASQFHPVSGNTLYSVAHISVSQGTHTISDDIGSGFLASFQGRGHLTSYASNVGYIPASAHLTPQLKVNDIPVDSPDATSAMICQHDSVFFFVMGPNDIQQVSWSFGDGLSSVGNPVRHTFDTAGTFHVMAIVSYHNSTQHHADTLHTIIQVNPTYLHYTSDTIHSWQLPWLVGDTLLYEATDSMTIRSTSQWGCDSTLIYSLYVLPISHTYFDTLICDTLLPLTWHGRYYNIPTIDTLYYIDQYGGDSLVIYTLDTICCRPAPNDGLIWAPNIFSPEQNDNDRFRIYCHNIRKAEVAIYHRWGLFVTRFDGLTGCWDGTKNGVKAPSGAYVYKVTYSTNLYPSETHTLVGTVLLIR